MNVTRIWRQMAVGAGGGLPVGSPAMLADPAQLLASQADSWQELPGDGQVEHDTTLQVGRAFCLTCRLKRILCFFDVIKL